MAYYVPTLKSMSSLRAYTSIENARAYAIKKMDEAGLERITIFKDKNRMTVAGRIEKGYGIGFRSGKVDYLYFPADFKPSFTHEANWYSISKKGTRKLKGGF